MPNDGLGRLTQLKMRRKHTIINDNQYSYNSAGELFRTLTKAARHAYGYDASIGCTSATYTGTAAESYAYDGVWQSHVFSSERQLWLSAFNRLTGTSTTGYLYDNNGNMTNENRRRRHNALAWDFENRLTQVVDAIERELTYKYDGLGVACRARLRRAFQPTSLTDGDEVVQDKTSTNVITEISQRPGIDNKIRQKGASNKTTYYFTRIISAV